MALLEQHHRLQLEMSLYLERDDVEDGTEDFFDHIVEVLSEEFSSSNNGENVDLTSKVMNCYNGENGNDDDKDVYVAENDFDVISDKRMIIGDNVYV